MNPKRLRTTISNLHCWTVLNPLNYSYKLPYPSIPVTLKRCTQTCGHKEKQLYHRCGRLFWKYLRTDVLPDEQPVECNCLEQSGFMLKRKSGGQEGKWQLLWDSSGPCCKTTNLETIVFSLPSKECQSIVAMCWLTGERLKGLLCAGHPPPNPPTAPTAAA